MLFYRLFRSADTFTAGLGAVFGMVNAVAILGSAAVLATALDVADNRSLGLELVGGAVEEGAGSTSRSAVSRKFVAMTEHALGDLLGKDLSDLDLVALMIDGVHLADHLCVVALGSDIDGTKHPLALVEDRRRTPPWSVGCWSGCASEAWTSPGRSCLCWTEPKALAAAVKEVFDRPVIARCQIRVAQCS